MLLLITFIIGLIVGSFLNVVIYRLPQQILSKNINLINPKRSCCPLCRQPLKIWMLIPIFSYLWQKGQCYYCKDKISIRYPLVELSTALLTLAIIYQFSFSLQSIVLVILVCALLCLLMIDWQHQLLPDVITLPLLWLGLLVNTSYLNITKLDDAVTAAVIGYLLLWSVYWCYYLIRKKEGIGYGDFKLLACLGAWFGLQTLLTTLTIACGLAIFFALFTKRKEIPFGVFLILAVGYPIATI